jgi:hypothetical protein
VGHPHKQLYNQMIADDLSVYIRYKQTSEEAESKGINILPVQSCFNMNLTTTHTTGQIMQFYFREDSDVINPN